MTLTKARGILASTFLSGLLIQAVAVIYVYLNNGVKPDTLKALLIKLLTVYSVHLAIILGGIFGQQGRNKPTGLAFKIALAVSVIWNLLLVWRSVKFGLSAEDSAKELIEYLGDISSASAFLVAGALTYFFSKQ